MKIDVGHLSGTPVDALAVEIVERKGLGHPDTICDALAEEFSLALCRFYRDRFGLILHHNVDKVLLWGGASRPAFGGGEVIEPLTIFLAGRATREFKGVTVPVDELAVASVRRWLQDHLHALDPERHVKVRALVRPGSRELAELYVRQRQAGVFLANDTSCGVGFAPLSDLERVVLAVERELNAAAVRAARPEAGEDVKVMGVRHGDRIHLTVACALIGRFIRDIDDYARKKSEIAKLAAAAACRHTAREVAVDVNTADDLASGSVYLTVTGTSAEAGDDGQAGRGNRINGLITPYRPMTIESAAGKNPVTHVGKLYNIAAGLIAQAVAAEVPGVAAAECVLVSQIGRRIDQPEIVDIKIRPHELFPAEEFRNTVEEVARTMLTGIGGLAEDILAGTLALDGWPLRR